MNEKFVAIFLILFYCVIFVLLLYPLAGILHFAVDVFIAGWKLLN